MKIFKKKLNSRVVSSCFTAAFAVSVSAAITPGVQNPPPGPGQVPDYFGVVPNYANSPQPILTTVTIVNQGAGAVATAGFDADGTQTGIVGAITAINIVNKGIGYIAPVVTITDGTDSTGLGTGATATATKDSQGKITGISINNAGSGYTQPVITIMDTGVGGSGAVAAATTYDYATDTPKDGIVDIKVLNGGQNYTNETYAAINGGSGVTMPAEVVPVITGGVITGFTVNNPGAGYRKAPLAGTGIRKFVDSLPTLNGTANDLGQTIPVARPNPVVEHKPDGAPKLMADGVTQVTSDYYVIGEVEYTQKLHKDLPPTHLRGYVQLDPVTGNAIGSPQYLGPFIVAQKDRPVRVKLVNMLPTGKAGELPIPVDHTYMGSVNADETDNRTALHLHGGVTPWISDGTPRQWIKPAGEIGKPRGESARDVPDMWFDASGKLIERCTGMATCDGAKNNPGADALTFYFTNEQSARLMFYHDHAEGITRLNMYDGLAAGYVIRDQTERDLIDGTNKSGNNTTGANGAPVAVLPSDEIPIIVQEKTFIPDNTTPVLNFYGPFASALNSQDPTWRWGTGTAPTGLNGNGDLWVPHVFMPNQNPGDPSGANAVGRWDYGPWFWPPFVGIQNGPLPNPYYDSTCNATTGVNVNALLGTCEGQFIPGVPNGAVDVYGANDPKSQPSGTPESFNDTPLVNGTVYPYVNVEPKKYRLRILSAGNDRHFNLSMVVASSKNSDTTADANAGATSSTATSNTCDGVNLNSANSADCTEVRMVPWEKGQNSSSNFPSHWYSPQKTGVVFDGRPSGVFDPKVRGPAMVQIGNEGGFLSKPVVIKNQPVNFEYNVKNILVGNVKEHALLLGPAERADVVVDFSKFAGSTIILYNDAPAALPAGDLRLDYYTGDYDNTDTGGAFSTLPGYGPNSRTIMQFRVADNCTSTNCPVSVNNSHPVDYVDPTYLAELTSAVSNAFKTSQQPLIVPQAAYNGAYGTNVSDVAGGDLSTISSTSLSFQPLCIDALTDLAVDTCADGKLDKPVTLTLQPKSIIEDWTVDFGRMNAMLGVEMPHTTAINQTSIPQGYIDPATELVKISQFGSPISGELADGTQIWKITHNGVDTHPVHFHLFHVQLINRVGWDGAIYPPEENELGWKDTVRMNPLSDTIVALRPVTLTLPFKLGNSHRVMDPTNASPAINTAMSFNLNPTTGGSSDVLNDKIANFGWEYAWHCHILGHEENDFMRPISVAHQPEDPMAVTLSGVGVNTGTGNVTVNWTDNSMVSNWVEIQRATDSAFTQNLVSFSAIEPECDLQAGCVRSYTDTSAPAYTTVYYRVKSNNTVGMGSGILEAGYDPTTGNYNQFLPANLVSLTPNFAGYSNATASSAWSGTVSRSVVPMATLNPVSGSTLTFADQPEGSASAAQTVKLTNTGTANLAISSIKLSGGALNGADYSATTDCTASLAASSTCTVNLTFKPSKIGVLSDTLTISDNSGGSATTQTINLTGTGTAPITVPAAVVTPATLDFGDVMTGATATAQTVTVSNEIGTASLNISSIAASSQFAVSGGTCSTATPLAAGSTCTVNVVYKPTSGGAFSGTLIITDNAGNVAGATQQVTLKGTGVQLVAVNNLTAQVNAANALQLNWSDNSTGETNYRIQRCIATAANLNCAANSSGWTTITAGLSPAGALISAANGSMAVTLSANLPQRAINYRVYPMYGNTIGPVSNVANVNLNVNPAAPTNVVATAGVGTVGLAWTDTANNNISYRFRSRYQISSGVWSPWVNTSVTAGANATSQTLTAAQIGAIYQPGRTMQFQVGATNEAGASRTSSGNVVVQ